MAEIGRLQQYGIGMEAVAGTADTIDLAIPLEDGNLLLKTDNVPDESGYSNICSPAGLYVAKKWSEFEGKGFLRPTSAGYIMLATMGATTAPTLLETGVYKHTFTIKNDNAHPSMTIVHKGAVQQEKSTYNMIDTVTITAEVGNLVGLDFKTKGRIATNTSGETMAYLTADNPFIVSKASVKIAANIAGLAGASKIPVQNFKITIDKNLEQTWATMENGTEALDFSLQNNKNFAIKGDFEALYTSDAFKTLALAGTPQALQIVFEGRTLIGATKYESLTITMNSVVFKDWGRSTGKDDLVSQQFAFEALYNLVDAGMATVELVNSKSTIYS